MLGPDGGQIVGPMTYPMLPQEPQSPPLRRSVRTGAQYHWLSLYCEIRQSEVTKLRAVGAKPVPSVNKMMPVESSQPLPVRLLVRETGDARRVP